VEWTLLKSRASGIVFKSTEYCCHNVLPSLLRPAGYSRHHFLMYVASGGTCSAPASARPVRESVLPSVAYQRLPTEGPGIRKRYGLSQCKSEAITLWRPSHGAIVTGALVRRSGVGFSYT